MIQNDAELRHSLEALEGLRQGRLYLIADAVERGIENPEQLGHVQAVVSFAEDIQAEIDEYLSRRRTLESAAE